MQAVARQEITEALMLVFGESGQRLPRTINSAILKQVYRKQVFKHHPDRHASVGGLKARLVNQTAALNRSYSLLTKLMKFGDIETKCYLGDRFKKSVTPKPASRRSGPQGKRPRSPGFKREACPEEFWSGIVPSHELKFGQFLFYNGVVSRGGLMKALAWQISQQHPFGYTAVGLGYFSPSQLSRILDSRIPGELLGDCAIRCGVMTPDQRNAVLRKQQAFLEPIGSYFIRSGILSPSHLHEYLRRQRHHNLAFV